jgi:glycosyltransferase involved in cell wall biosynthesis
MAWNLLTELRKFPELELLAVLLNEGRLAEELRSHDLEVRIIEERRLSFPRLLLAVRTFLREKSPDVIHSHRYKENILAFFTRGAGRNRARLVATQHGMPEPGPQGFKLAGRVVAWLNRHILSRRFDRLVAVSHDMRDHFIGPLGFAPTRVVVIHNGIDITDDRNSNGAGPRSQMVVGSAGRLFPVKDYLLMVKIARELCGEGKIYFTLAGDGVERMALEGSIKEFGLAETFTLKGNVEDMDSFYCELDLYVNTSLHEGIPMSILEAMAHGLPVVAPKVGGITEIIADGVEGFLIPTRDPRDFAEKCLLLQRDPALRMRMGLAARARVEGDFSAPAMAEQYRRLYHELAG